MSGEKLQIRSMKVEDIYNITGLTEMLYDYTMELNNVKYNKLLVNGANFYIAFVHDSMYLWGVHGDGRTSRSSAEYRNSSSCFS